MAKPKTGRTKVRDYRILVRFNSKEKKQIHAAAAKRGLKLGPYLRMCALEAAAED